MFEEYDDKQGRTFWLTFWMFCFAGLLLSYGCALVYQPLAFIVGGLWLAFLAIFYTATH